MKLPNNFRALIFVGAAMICSAACAQQETNSARAGGALETNMKAETEAETASVGDDADWHLVWSDEFDGRKLDRTKWTPEVSCWGGGNNERQCYRDSSKNIKVEDGVLRLIAKKGRHTGQLYPASMPDMPKGKAWKPYTSGKVTTQGLAAYKYGRFSARMKLPEGQGTWPAFWMMPETNAYGNWPLSGELDIMEAVNLETPCDECPNGVNRRTSGALHFGSPQPDNTYFFLHTEGDEQVGPSDEWRVYSVEWAEGVIQWLVDDKVFMRLESDDWFTTAPEAEGRPHAPFDQPFHLILNMAAGGNLAEKSNGGGFDPKSFPAELQVDWVRVEQCRADWKTGLPCLSDQDWQGEPQGPWEVQAR